MSTIYDTSISEVCSFLFFLFLVFAFMMVLFVFVVSVSVCESLFLPFAASVNVASHAYTFGRYVTITRERDLFLLPSFLPSPGEDVCVIRSRPYNSILVFP